MNLNPINILALVGKANKTKRKWRKEYLQARSMTANRQQETLCKEEIGTQLWLLISAFFLFFLN
jgi:hypothetical protein